MSPCRVLLFLAQLNHSLVIRWNKSVGKINYTRLAIITIEYIFWLLLYNTLLSLANVYHILNSYTIAIIAVSVYFHFVCIFAIDYLNFSFKITIQFITCYLIFIFTALLFIPRQQIFNGQDYISRQRYKFNFAVILTAVFSAPQNSLYGKLGFKESIIKFQSVNIIKILFYFICILFYFKTDSKIISLFSISSFFVIDNFMTFQRIQSVLPNNSSTEETPENKTNCEKPG